MKKLKPTEIKSLGLSYLCGKCFLDHGSEPRQETDSQFYTRKHADVYGLPTVSKKTCFIKQEAT